MKLSLKNESYNGFYIGEAQIIKVERLEDPFSSSTAPDECYAVTVDIGKDFTPQDLFYGNYKKNEFGEIVGLGSVFRITNLLKNILGVEQLDTETLQEDMENLVGKTIHRLTYKKSEKGYKTYAYDIDKEALQKRFEKDVSLGKIKDFMRLDQQSNKIDEEIKTKLGGKIW